MNNLQEPFEPKVSNRYIVKFPERFNIPDYLVSDFQRPSITYVNGYKHLTNFEIKFYDVVFISVLKTLTDKFGEVFDINLIMLDPIGEVIETITYKDCAIISIDPSLLSYQNDSKSSISVTINSKNMFVTV